MTTKHSSSRLGLPGTHSNVGEMGSSSESLGAPASVPPEGMYRNCRGTWVTKPRVHPRACEMCGKSAYPGQDMVQVPRTHQRKLCPTCLPLKRAANSQRLRGPSEPKAFLDAMRGPRVTKDRAVPEDSRDHAKISWSSLKPSFFPSVDEWDEDFAK